MRRLARWLAMVMLVMLVGCEFNSVAGPSVIDKTKMVAAPSGGVVVESADQIGGGVRMSIVKDLKTGRRFLVVAYWQVAIAVCPIGQ